MKLYLRLAWRNIWRHRRRTLIVVLAIGLSTSLMILYQGLMAGFDQAIYGNAIKVMGGNIQVHAPGYNDHTDEHPMLPLENDQAVVDAAHELAADAGGHAAHQYRRHGHQPRGGLCRRHRRHRAGGRAVRQPGRPARDARAAIWPRTTATPC